MIIIQKTIALTFYILRLKTDMGTAKLVQLNGGGVKLIHLADGRG